MSVTVHFACDGCDATASGTTFLRRHFHSFNGRGYGFGTWSMDKAEDMAPEGWVPFDPVTGACYCPECWADIMKEAG